MSIFFPQIFDRNDDRYLRGQASPKICASTLRTTRLYRASLWRLRISCCCLPERSLQVFTAGISTTYTRQSSVRKYLCVGILILQDWILQLWRQTGAVARRWRSDCTSIATTWSIHSLRCAFLPNVLTSLK